jgi:ABC-type branched-subunit amino acid transport system substrate-binding protein
MYRRVLRPLTAAVALAVLAAACSTANGDKTTASSTGSTAKQLTASARGVTPSTIKIGFSYIDLETLAKAGVIKIDHGPYADIIKALVDDVNSTGGINGRKLQLVTAKYSPIGNTEQLSACSKLTEDAKVFAVLNGLLDDNNLCIVQQHATILVGANPNGARLAKARAPWISYTATDERAIAALVRVLDNNGELKGHTIGVYAAQAANKPLIDLGVKSLQDAGYHVADTALLDVPEDDTQAATAQDKVIAQRMMNKHIDTVVDVGKFIPGADFDAAGFHPRLFSVNSGNIAAAAFTNPLGKFPVVAGLGALADPDAVFRTAAFRHCVDVWKRATGKTIETSRQEDIDGKSSGNVAMQIACTTLQLFVAAAKAAGPNLNNQTFATGAASLGTIELANTPTASFGLHKPDGQDSFQLVRFDPTWKQGQGKQQFIPVGQPITLSS